MKIRLKFQVLLQQCCLVDGGLKTIGEITEVKLCQSTSNLQGSKHVSNFCVMSYSKE